MPPENPAITTLKQAFSSLSDLCLHSFNQLPTAAQLQHKWSHMDQQYKLTATTFLTSTAKTLNQLIPSASDMQQKWNRIDAQYNLTATTINIFNQSVHFFKKVFTAEMAARFVTAVVVFGCVCTGVKLVLSLVVFVVWCLRPCLWFGGKATVKMMKAPGKPAVMIARSLFEANPQEYFSNLHGRR